MDVGMEFSRRPEELPKPEGLPEPPPAPAVEKPLYNTSNIDPVVSNVETGQTALPLKPAFTITTPPAVGNLTELPLQPVQDIDIAFATEANSDTTMHHPHVDHAAFQNGDAGDGPAPTNGASSFEMNGKLNSPSPLDPPQVEGTTAASSIPFSSSSIPASSSFDPFTPSAPHVDPLDTATTDTPQESLASASELQPAPERALTSNARSSPQPLPQNSETALRIKSDRPQPDLAKNREVVQGLAVGGNGLIAPTVTREPAPTLAEERPATLDMGTSLHTYAGHTSAIADAAPFAPPLPAAGPVHVALPAEQPQAPPSTLAWTPTTPETSTQLQVDQPMVDAPPSPGKVSRERDEEGDEHGPAAKRLKAEDGPAEPEFKVPEAPAHSPPLEQRPTDQAAPADDRVTGPRLAHMKKVIANLKKSAISLSFREPVNPVALNIPTYFEIIKQPMDLGTVDRRLKSSSYNKVSDFVEDFHLIVDNAITFNGPGHVVAQAGAKMRQSFNNQMRALPPAHFALPAKEEKKSTKAKEHPVRSASQRRPSGSQAPAAGPARSPVTPGSATTFALGPEGMPLIRRDSTVADGRPKRAIHPPKRRDHEFGPGRPRKKKYEWQLKFCKEVITEMKKAKYYSFAQYFYLPVDPVALNIPSYHKVVKKPMDMETVERKLDTNQYEKARDFEEDVRQIFKNCYLFNQPGEVVYTAGQQLEKLFEEKWATKDEWLASHEPASEPQSAGDEDEEDEGSEDEEDDSADERNDEIAQLKAQIAMMSQTIGNLQSGPKKKKKATPPAPAVAKKSGKAKKKDKPPSLPGPQPAGKDKKKSSSKPKAEKEHFVTYIEKQYISNGISSLPDARMSEALKIIQSNVPSLKNTHETEIELDIDELPNHVLLKLLNFVKKYGDLAPPEPEPPQPPAYPPPVSAPSKPKKNKPMSKQEQEQQIRELKGKLGAYDGGQPSPDATRSVENAVESSGDDDSEESEEE